METKLAINSNSRYFDFLNGFVIKLAPWLWEAPVATKRSSPESRLPFCGHGGVPEPRSKLNHKTVEEITISGI